MTLIYVIGVLMIGATIYTFFKCIGTPNKNLEKRTDVMTEKILTIGGNVVNIETKKRSDYPFGEEINQDDGSYHVFYKIQYTLEDEIKEGWAVLKLQQSFVGPVGATTDEWIWKL